MATTEANVCNMALLKCGHREFIDDLEEQSEAAAVCKMLYADTRDFLLERFEWSFAEKMVSLAVSTETDPRWAYVYREPADCLMPRYLWTGDRNPPVANRYPTGRRLSAASDGFLFLCDVAEASLVYTAKLDAVALFSKAFTEALASELAVRIALALPVKPELARALAPLAALRLGEAIAADLLVTTPDVPPDAESIRARL